MNKTHFSNMKIGLGLIASFVWLQTATAQFSFPVYEPFSEYQQGESLRAAGSSGTNWTSGNSANNSQIITTNAALSYLGLMPDSFTPQMGVSGPTGVGRTALAPFTSQSSGTVYASVLVNLKSYPSGNRAIFGLGSTTASTPNPGTGAVAVWVNSSGQLLLSKNNQTTPNTPTTVALPLNTTHLLVISYTFVAGATTNDTISLWLDPVALGNNGNIPTPNISFANYAGAGADSSAILAVALYAPSSTPTMQTYYDEIRIDNNWAGVTPSAPAPGPVFTVTGGGNGCPGDSFDVSLSGSVTTNVYYLYTNAVYSGISATGTGAALDFGPQNISGIYTVVASNTVSGNQGYMTGSATITILAPPVITTQPSSVIVAANGLTTFTLAASGTGLNYQWYTNGVKLTDGGHFSGSQTATLTVFPATTAEQETITTGYYCVITNHCMATAISTTNALTIDSPVNVVWQGGNPNTNWDTGTTLNWTNSAGTARVFNAGDNAIFDDTSTNPVVTITGISVAPTTITEMAAQNYFITAASKPIAGPGSLTMSGSGTLAISNANTFTGGTVINSGGTVSVRDANQQALGIGPVTLAGGKLDIALKSGVTSVGMTNSLNVTASSVLQYDGSGSLAFDLFGGINGSPSATLTIQGFLNSTAAGDRMRLYGSFTNNAQININIAPLAGDEIELAPYNSTPAIQLYNGVISGTGGRFTLRGSGEAIFAGANTFNDSGVNNNGAGPSGYSILMSSGNLGIGADSSPDFLPIANGGPVGSSPLGMGIVGINQNSASEGGNCSIFAYGGSHSVSNSIIYTSATNSFSVSVTGSNNLTLAGPLNLNGADSTGGTNRVWNVSNTGLTTISGIIGDAGLTCGLTKSGAGRLALAAANTYTGPTLVSAGTLYVNGSVGGTVTATNGSLGGTGTISGVTTIQSPGTLAPGTSAIGTLTINNNLTLAGNAVFKVNKSLSPQSNDVASVSGSLTASGSGTLTVSNIGPAVVVGDRFVLFNAPVTGGSSLSVTGAGMVWTNRLAFDGSITALSVASTVNTNATNITFSVTGGGTTLNLSWPADHTGWRLQVQTNSRATGLTPVSSAWFTVPGSTGVNSTNFPINPLNGAVFYRLVYP